MLRHSTGFRNDILGNGAFSDIFANCFIDIYTGSQPASADDAATGTLLMTISDDGGGGGLNFSAPSGGVISKDTATWKGTGVANGTAGWFRIYENTDDPSLSSTTTARIDGQIAVSGAEWNIYDTSITISGALEVYTFTYTFPIE